jgi:hypothetical protein
MTSLFYHRDEILLQKEPTALILIVYRINSIFLQIGENFCFIYLCIKCVTMNVEIGSGAKIIILLVLILT